MNRLICWILGYCRVKISGAYPEGCLNRFSGEHLMFWDPRTLDEFTVSLSIPAGDLSLGRTLAEQTQCSIEQVAEFGLPSKLRRLKKRIFFIILFALVIAVCILLSRRVWFYRVEGNHSVPSQKIIREVRSAGVSVGTKGKDIVPQKVKDRVLARIPELAWLTVTQSGGSAVIVVREKLLPEPVRDRHCLQNIVAVRSGIVDELSVLDGSPEVKKGDAVDQGQLLISAYVDLEYKIRATCARGEVYAATWHRYEMVIPEEYKKKLYNGQEKTVRYLCFGKKQFKISGDSEVLECSSEKRTDISVLTLPGGYELPVCLIRETYRFYETEPGIMEQDTAEELLHTAAQRRANSSMVAGEIKNTTVNSIMSGGLVCLTADFACREMIGRSVDAEIFKDD